jgi:MFS transporter, PAT family, beta-lactamase induction signal transducer AmpG
MKIQPQTQSSFRKIISLKMLTQLILGFSSGLPLLLVGGTLKTWLAREQVDISTIGYFSWVGMSYSLKFLWAPFLDRFFVAKVGRRKTWMLTTQVFIAVLLFVIGTMTPQVDLFRMAILAVLISFMSATQDIAIDAYRREVCDNDELAMGSTLSIYGYRLAMILTGGIGVGLVGGSLINLSWGGLYWFMATFMAAGFVITLLSKEPEIQVGSPTSLYSAVIDPFREFMSRDGALIILLFVFLFKLGDALGGSLLTPFYVEMGYSNADIGLIAKTVGLTSSLVGMFLGGLVMIKLGMMTSLWIFGVLQALSTAGFALITFTGPTLWALSATVIFEDVSAGMGNAAFVAFIASISNRKYTATQFAILSSVAMLGRNFFSGFTGAMVKSLGWTNFFFACGLIAVPGLIMLYFMSKKNQSTSLP